MRAPQRGIFCGALSWASRKALKARRERFSELIKGAHEIRFGQSHKTLTMMLWILKLLSFLLNLLRSRLFIIAIKYQVNQKLELSLSASGGDSEDSHKPFRFKFCFNIETSGWTSKASILRIPKPAQCWGLPKFSELTQRGLVRFSKII